MKVFKLVLTGNTEIYKGDIFALASTKEHKILFQVKLAYKINNQWILGVIRYPQE